MPNFEEIWPSDKNKDDKYKRRLIGMEYYMDVSTSIYIWIRKCVSLSQESSKSNDILFLGDGEPRFEGPPAPT